MAPRATKPAAKTTRQQTALAVCAAVAEGSTLTTEARALGIPRRTLRRWVESPGIKPAYEDACKARLELMEERLAELCRLAHDAAQDGQNPVAKIRACELEIHTLQWQLAKLYPARYGDKSQLELTGKDGASLLPRHTLEEEKRFAAIVAAAQAKTPPHKS